MKKKAKREDIKQILGALNNQDETRTVKYNEGNKENPPSIQYFVKRKVICVSPSNSEPQNLSRIVIHGSFGLVAFYRRSHGIYQKETCHDTVQDQVTNPHGYSTLLI